MTGRGIEGGVVDGSKMGGAGTEGEGRFRGLGGARGVVGVC